MMKTQKILLMVGTAFAMAPIMVACASVGGDVPCTVDSDCLEGEFCNNPNDTPDGGLCQTNGDSGEGEGEGEDGVACTSVPDDGACLEDRPDGTDPSLCDGSICVEPNSLTAGCDGGQGHNDAGGPVVYGVEVVLEGTEGDTCPAGFTTFVATVYSEEDFDDSLNGQRLKFLPANGGDAEGTYSEVGLLPAAEPVVANPGYFSLTFYLCGNGTDGAIFLSNNADVDGNAACIP